MHHKAEKKGPWNNSKNESADKQIQNLKLPILNAIIFDDSYGFHEEEKDYNDDNNMNEIETNDDNDIIVNIDSGNLKEKSVSCIISNRKKKYFHLTLDEAVYESLNRIRQIVALNEQVVGAISGDVNSFVAAKFMKEAIGDRFHVILVDNGVMRLDECQKVKKSLKDHGINLKVKILFESEALLIDNEAKESHGKIEYLLQGTLYPDVIESILFKGRYETQALDEELIWRHPFPGPGIAIRILGEVTPSQAKIVQAADNIYIEKIKKAGLYRKISQAYAALLPVKAVGVMGDKRTYGQVIVLRAVETIDFDC
ncbi:hypothetical protein Glove_283g102 [Diversispora epigaea]|uniref:GMP synthase (glutamine-hydrolyzing) n=1 Tax=Diversispora epigaea TaxID=1348612 RepID=A0A397I8K9_9GLOM|nr:hypothetical protein Glove_283g102 [Diversispora epigaea]